MSKHMLASRKSFSDACLIPSGTVDDDACDVDEGGPADSCAGDTHVSSEQASSLHHHSNQSHGGKQHCESERHSNRVRRVEKAATLPLPQDCPDSFDDPPDPSSPSRSSPPDTVRESSSNSTATSAPETVSRGGRPADPSPADRGGVSRSSSGGDPVSDAADDDDDPILRLALAQREKLESRRRRRLPAMESPPPPPSVSLAMPSLRGGGDRLAMPATHVSRRFHHPASFSSSAAVLASHKRTPLPSQPFAMKCDKCGSTLTVPRDALVAACPTCGSLQVAGRRCVRRIGPASSHNGAVGTPPKLPPPYSEGGSRAEF